jgi:hypothetical protein
MIPANSVAICARRSIGTAAGIVAGRGCVFGAAPSLHCDQACIQAVMPRRKNNAPQPLDGLFGTTGSLAAELLILLGQIRMGSRWTSRLVQRRFF